MREANPAGIALSRLLGSQAARHDVIGYRLKIEGDLFMMITGYFDESQTSPDQNTPIVAGYLSSAFQWARFNLRWARLLQKHDVPFHPTLDARISHRGRMHPDDRIFGPWVNAHRGAFISDAFKTIQEFVRVPLGNAVYTKDFEEIVPWRFREEIGGAYGWCVHSTLYGVKWWCEKNNYKIPIRLVFENVAHAQMTAVERWYAKYYNNPRYRREFRLGGLSFRDKSVRPLQAADFLAYGLGRYARNFAAGIESRPVVEALMDLLGPVPPKDSKVVFWDRPQLEGLARNLSAGGFKAWERLQG